MNQRHKKLRNFREARNNQEATEKLLRNFREVRNNQETIKKLSGNYREVRNFTEINREIIKKFSRNYQEISEKLSRNFREISRKFPRNSLERATVLYRAFSHLFEKIHGEKRQTRDVIYYIKLKSRPSAVFWSTGSLLWMQGSASNLIEMKRPSSGNTKFVFKRF